MDTALKVTDQPEEIAFNDMVGGDNVINIPLFQRAYRWKVANLNEFWDDIDSILDGSSRSHFLGVLVLVSQSRKVGQPIVLDVVDGQQRLTTCYLTVMAMAYVAAENGEHEWASEVVRSFLLTRNFSTFSTNTRLIPSADDRQQFHNIWARISNLTPFSEGGFQGTHAATPTPSGDSKGPMQKAFDHSLKRCRTLFELGGFSQLEEVFEIIVGKLSFVTINLRNPTAAPAIFERLNARGEKINISDLVRNEIFSRVADDAAKATSIFETHWQPFVAEFHEKGASFEKFLFPYGLIVKPSITKADLFSLLRDHWNELGGPREIIKSMATYVDGFILLETGEKPGKLPAQYENAAHKLHQLGAPSTSYSFLLRLSHAVYVGDVDEVDAIEVLKVLESFFFRRAVCGFEPSGLHAVFKNLWNECIKEHGVINAESVQRSISKRSTVPWPNDALFSEQIMTGDLYHRRVVKFALREYELFTEGETPEDDFHIEHIFPQKPNSDWGADVVSEMTPFLHSWANLIPLTNKVNPAVGNSTFLNKSTHYQKSIFASPREVSKKNKTWGLADLSCRSREISNWALMRWPYSAMP